MPNFSHQVVHLSTGASGGAGLAARRLNFALNKNGLVSTFLANENEDFTPGPNEFALRRNFRRRLSSGITTLTQNRHSNRVLFSINSYPALDIANLKKSFSPANSILHIHNWFNLLNLNTIEQLLKTSYPIVFTMHDQRLMTGACHYSFACKEFMNGCFPCPEVGNRAADIHKNLIQQARIFSKYSSQLLFIAPSKWMEASARKSRILANQKIYWAPNSLGDFSSGQNFEKPLKRSGTTLCVGVASMDIGSYIKGSDRILQIVDEAKKSGVPLKVLYLKEVLESKLPPSNFWSQIDALIVPSRADNSPNVIHEAKAFQIPIIGTNVGGIPELLTTPDDLILSAPDDSVVSLAEIVSFLEKSVADNPSKESPSDFQAIENLSVELHFQAYKALIKGEKFKI